MSIATFWLLVWYTLGIVGVWSACYTDHKRGEDFKLLDVALCVLCVNFGVLMFAVGVGHYFQHNPIKWPKIPNTVLIKGRPKNDH